MLTGLDCSKVGESEWPQERTRKSWTNISGVEMRSQAMADTGRQEACLTVNPRSRSSLTTCFHLSARDPISSGSEGTCPLTEMCQDLWRSPQRTDPVGGRTQGLSTAREEAAVCVCVAIGPALGASSQAPFQNLYFFLLGNSNVSKMQTWKEDKRATDE